ncbi:MAG TPA: hypothetical protein VGQ42_16395 [Candidatus Dormibacteraeota bacterium]|jgi:hypothetical protein|nr:hypothetical protein [Candidatus Dormibacteraeota bacterium]
MPPDCTRRSPPATPGEAPPIAASALAAALAAAFGVVVLDRWRRSRRAAFAAWSAGLFIFAAAALTQAIGQAGGFSVPLFRAFYLLGGVLGVIYLALGTVFLVAPPRVGRACAAVLLLLTVLIAVDAAFVPVDAAKLTSNAGILGDAVAGHGNPIYVAAVVFNILGTLVLCGGSAWSAWRFARTRAGLDRVVCNVLLTAGALAIAAGFSAAKATGGSLSTLGVYEAAGIAVMFAGFLSLGRVGRSLPGRGTLGGDGPVQPAANSTR